MGPPCHDPVRKEKGLSLKEAMKVAKETYRKK